MKAKTCPKCNSNNVKIEITAGAAFGTPQKWVCNKCGFQSYAVFPEEEIRAERRRKGK